MSAFSKVPPAWFLEKMSEKDRRAMFPGAAGMTPAEAAAVPIAKSEKELQRQIEQMLLRHGIQPTRQRMDKASNIAVGMPDISFSCQGRAVYWEVKMPGEKPTPEQTATMAKLAAPPNCAIVRVVTTYEQAFSELTQLLNMEPVNFSHLES
jgi:hypothetical protein